MIRTLFNLVLVGLMLLSQAAAQAESAPPMTGEQLYNDYGRGGCVSCHGADGNQPKMPLIPKIGGQSSPYLASQLRDYHHKRRVNGLYIPMENVMDTYTDDEIQRIADFLSTRGTF